MIGAVWLAALVLMGAGSGDAPSLAKHEPARLMQWSDLLSRQKPTLKPERIRYGNAPSQVIELWRPTTPGPHPVVAMLHGGCWTASVADLNIMDWAAADLATRGIAVWNIEYRRLGEAGGGYPGTYLDVGAALDKLKAEGGRRGLDLRRTVFLGHSAGGHLALWAAGRAKIPASSPLRASAPLAPVGVVAIGAITDLKADINTACGAEAPAKMAGPVTAERPNPYLDTSPFHMAPLGEPVFLITGAEDVTVPPSVAERYFNRGRTRPREFGLRGALVFPHGGHVEEIAPGSSAWALVVDQTKRLFQLAKGAGE